MKTHTFPIDSSDGLCINSSIMHRLLLISLLCLITATVPAQKVLNSAPVVWQRYKVSNANISLLFPKLPIKLVGYSRCLDFKTVNYHAYAEGVAYELSVTSEETSRPYVPAGCPKLSKFGRETLASRLGEIRGREDQPLTEQAKENSLQGYKFTSKTSTRWILSDLSSNKRWIELAVTHYPDEEPNAA